MVDWCDGLVEYVVLGNLAIPSPRGAVQLHGRQCQRVVYSVSHVYPT